MTHTPDNQEQPNETFALPNSHSSQHVSAPENASGNNLDTGNRGTPVDGSFASTTRESSGVQTFIQPEPQKNHSGFFIVGLAIGALVGGIVGGGTAALVTANSQSSSVINASDGKVTITNPETTTAVSAIASSATDSVVTLDVVSATDAGSGSGVIYSEDGYIITNAHVVTMQGSTLESTTVRALLSDGRMLPATIVGTDPYADIALLKVEADNLSAISIADSENLQVGDLTVAIGAPFNLSSTVTSGVISALSRGITVGSPLIPLEQQDPDQEGQSPWDFQFDVPRQDGQPAPAGGQVTLPVIQTDADINPGNSGGALLNGEGKLIGINVAIASTGQAQQAPGSVGLGFAIPIDLAVRVADSIIAGERPSHGLLGATVTDSRTSSTATHRGGLVQSIARGGAAEKNGFRPGDIITSVNGVPAADGTTVSALIRYHEGGGDVEIDFVRNDQQRTQLVTLDTLEW